MRRALASWLGLSVVFAAAIPAALAQDPLNVRIERAASCYARGDYDCVLDELTGFSVQEAVQTESRMDAELGARLLAITLIVRDVPTRARTILADALRVWPNFRFEGDDLSPRFLVVFDEARALVSGELAGDPVVQAARDTAERIALVTFSQELGGWVSERAETVVVTSIEAEQQRLEEGHPQLRIEVGPSLHFLTSTDAETFDSNFGFAVRLGTEALLGLAWELAFDYHTYGVLLTDLVDEVQSDLTVLNFSGNVGVPIRFGLFRVEVGCGAGYSSFGFQDAFERGGFLLDLYAQAGIQVPGRVGLSVEVRPRLVFVEGANQDVLVSSPVFVGVTASYEFLID